MLRFIFSVFLLIGVFNSTLQAESPEELRETAKEKGIAVVQEPPSDYETDRYSKVLEEFTTKHP